FMCPARARGDAVYVAFYKLVCRFCPEEGDLNADVALLLQEEGRLVHRFGASHFTQSIHVVANAVLMMECFFRSVAFVREGDFEATMKETGNIQAFADGFRTKICLRKDRWVRVKIDGSARASCGAPFLELALGNSATKLHDVL